MIETKLFEVRDAGTLVPVVAVACADGDERNTEEERWLLQRSGYGETLCIFLGKLATGGAEYDPYAWPADSRSLRVAHDYITRNWSSLRSGDVICVETILGERAEPKRSERLEAL